MKVAHSIRLLRAASRVHSPRISSATSLLFVSGYRYFHASPVRPKIQTHILSDIGEGVKEVQIIQWFIEEGAAVEEWAPLCEVQSDKASVEITSKYTGVVKKIHFERDAIVQVGDSMLDIEVEGDGESEERPPHISEGERQPDDVSRAEQNAEESEQMPPETTAAEEQTTKTPDKISDSHDGLATPAVRALLKEHGLDIGEVQGSGKDGRVLKDDVYKHLEEDKPSRVATSTQSTPLAPTVKPEADAKQVEIAQNLTPVQSAMFKSMTKSLSIPHFLFSDNINVTSLTAMRINLNASRASDSMPKLSYLPFVIKAVSLALNKYPILNARLDMTDSNKPKLQLRSNHNIGVAMDTPAGLLVPVIKSVNARSITSIAQELQRLSQLGQAGKLSNNDLHGGTITVSNIGNIGGAVVGPVIVEGQLAILGLGKIKPTPIFAADGKTVERAELMSASWSADHRVIDGATMARVAKIVQDYLEKPEKMIVDLS